MIAATRNARFRRGGRRPGWLLMTALLVLAIAASSALVFTDRVELLKLAVILSLWAAVVAAFASVVYRRQSDADQSKVRDLKLVYDLQLEREISARREYELTVESNLRYELASELRSYSADEVSALRAELHALRSKLEILFDTDLTHRPAIEQERTTVRAYSDWARDVENPARAAAVPMDAEDRDNSMIHTAESPIIDVAAVPQPGEPEWPAAEAPDGGTHRRPSGEPASRHQVQSAPDSETTGQLAALWRVSSDLAEHVGRHTQAPHRPPAGAHASWSRPAADDEWVAHAEANGLTGVGPPADEPIGGQDVAPQSAGAPQVDEGAPVTDFAGYPPPVAADLYPPPVAADLVFPGPEPAVGAFPAAGPPEAAPPAMSVPPPESAHGRHVASHEGDAARAPQPPAMAPPPSAEITGPLSVPRHLSAGEAQGSEAEAPGGRSAAELLARFQVQATGGGRRRRHEE
jgi:hypothetical protein